MLLLTWHGTIVCLRQGGGGLVHLPLPLTEPMVVPLDVEPGDDPGADTRQMHPALGFITVGRAPFGPGITLSRYGRFLCAEDSAAQMAFDREAAAVWEMFLPITQPDLERLRHLAANRWILPQSRKLLRHGAVGPAEEFQLAVGKERVALADCLPFAQDAGAAPERVRITAGNRLIELAQAGPRSSALLKTDRWPVRARRTAEIMVLAVHRQLGGTEPEQMVFERDVGFLLEHGGPDGLADLLEQVGAGLPERGVMTQAAESPATSITQPVIPLGTACIVACILRGMGLDQPPLPFDWLATTPAMIRHCLETDFAVLLDRTQYRSLTGLGGPAEPEDGCAHEFYAREHGIGRVFNHNDPTREADYRYTQACIDRLRDILAADGPKLFVQMREAGPNTRQDFDTTSALIGKLTRNGSLVQIAVSQPDRRQALPLLNVVSERGASVLYRLHPLSPLGGEAFANAADTELVVRLIAAHANRAGTLKRVADGDRSAVQAAAARFDAGRPPDPSTEGETTQQATLELANHALNRFLETVGLPRRYRFAGIDPAKLPGRRTREACLAQIAGQQATLRAPLDHGQVWTRLQRSLVLIYLFDLLLADGPMPETRFLAEFGDAGYEDRSATFCSNHAGSCLLPDSDFFVSGGYDSVRRQVDAAPIAWKARRPVVFWRGGTTGQRRHAAPGDGEDDDFTWLPRLDLCRRADVSALAQHYDVGISHVCQIAEPHLLARIEDAGLRRPAVPRAGFLGSKAILVIDGNTNAWSALFCALLTGACVLKVESPKAYRQWYYGDLKPWTHFVPVSEDLHDLDDRTAWLLAHDEDARGIAQAGQALVRAMTFESVMSDAAIRLRAWINEA